MLSAHHSAAGPVWPEPELAPSALRDRMPAPPPPQLRVLTYNLLADQYASSEYAQKVWLRCSAAHTLLMPCHNDPQKPHIFTMLTCETPFHR